MDVATKNTVEYSVNNSVKSVLNMLDEAIDEYERGEFISEEEVFQELESIK